jgi:adenosylcobinamide-GDP ribazoletransferase
MTTGSSVIRRFILAVQFLTRLPTPRIKDFVPEDLSRSAPFFPLVGLMIGAILAAAMTLLAPIDPWVAGLIVLVAWVWVTGALHLDGLGDVADALGAAHRNPDRFQEVLRDPHIGAFGAIAMTLQIIAKLVLLAAVARSATFGAALVLIPAWARWGTLVWSDAVPPLTSGMGERFAWAIDRKATVGWGVVLALASAWAAPWLLVALPLTVVVVLYWRWRLGGITGDCLGASVEVVESVLLLALVVGGGVTRL